MMVRIPAAVIVALVACFARSAPGQTSAPVAATRPATTQAVNFPDESTTGPKKGIELRPSGSVDARVAGMVIEGLDIRGRILVEAPDVVIRNCRIVAPAEGVGIKITGSGPRTLIEDCEITGPDSTNGISGSNYTARRLHIHHMGADAFRVVTNVTIESCYIHDLGLAPKSHGDGVQMYPTTGGNMRIVGNHIDARGANAALFEVNNGWQVEKNYFNGGNYTIQCEGIAENVFRDNVFGPDAKYGPIRVGSGDSLSLTWENNHYSNGRAVPIPARKRKK